MKREIPGTQQVEGRKFMYIEYENKTSFSKFFYKIPTFGNSPIPTSGGSINENFIIELPNNKKMFGISFKGDLNGWYRKVLECCQINKLEWGEIENQSIKLSNNNSYLLTECDFHFY